MDTAIKPTNAGKKILTQQTVLNQLSLIRLYFGEIILGLKIKSK